MEEKIKKEKEEITSLLSKLTIEYEEFLPETFPINYTTLNPLKKIKELENKADEKTIDFKNTYNKINEILNKMVRNKYKDLNETLFIYQDLFKKYKYVNKITKNIISEHEIIKKKLFINFKKLLKNEDEEKKKNLIEKIYKKINEINEFIIKFKKSINKIKKSKNKENKEFEKNLIFYKINIISYLNFIKEYNLEENDFIFEMKIELNKCKQFFINYLKNQIIEFIFKELTNPIILSINILKELNYEKELNDLIIFSFKKLLYLNLNKICKKNLVELNSFKLNNKDIDLINNKDIDLNFELEILNYVIRVYLNIQLINLKDSYFLDKILYEIKRIFSLNSSSKEAFQLTNIFDSINYTLIFSNTNIEKYLNNSNELKYGEYNIYKKDFNLNIKRLIKLFNVANIKYENKKKNILIKSIINYAEIELKENLKNVDKKVSYFINDLILMNYSLKGDDLNKRLRFYPKFIKEIISYQNCLNFLNYFSYFQLIINLINKKYNNNKDRNNDIKNIKELFIEPSELFNKEDIKELIYTIYTINDLKTFLLKSSFLKLESINESKESFSILIVMFNDLINNLRECLKYKLLITIYFYFDKYLREGIDFIESIKTLFYGYNKNEKSLIDELHSFKNWEYQLFLYENTLLNNSTNNTSDGINIFISDFYKISIEASKDINKKKLFKNSFDGFYFSIIYTKLNELIKGSLNRIDNKEITIKNLMFLEELICLLETKTFHSYKLKNNESSSFLLSYKLLED